MSLLDDVSIVVTPNGYKAGELYAVIPVPTEGAEQVTNGDFATDTDWTKGTGWTISGGTATYNNLGVANNLTQNIGGIIGKVYEVKFTTKSDVSGALAIALASSYTSISVSADTEYSLKITSNGASLVIRATTNFTGSIDNVSVKEWVGADMDVTRATAATRVDENGLVNYALGVEEVTNGDFSNGSTDWTPYGSTFVVSNANPYNGNDTALFTASGVNGAKVTQSISTVIGNTYHFSCYAQYNSGDYTHIEIEGVLEYPNGLEVSNSLNTWTYLETSFTATSTTSIVAVRERGGSNNASCYLYGLSVKEVNNVPRIDYTGGGCPHILAEPQRTNLVTYSEDFSNSSWFNTGTTESIAASITDPSGNNNSYKLIESSNTGFHFTNTFTSTLSGANTFSFYAKSSERTQVSAFLSQSGNVGAIFNLSAETSTPSGTGNTSTIENVGNGWYRCVVSNNGSSEISNNIRIGVQNGALDSYTGDGTSGVFIWGAQIEQGSYPTSYIPTSGSTVTRNQDIFTRDGIGSLINSTEGVLFVEMAALSDDSTNRQLTLSDGSDTNRIVLKYDNQSNIIQSFNRVSGVETASLSATVSDITQFSKIAIKYKLNDYAMWIDGVEVDTDNTSTTFPSSTLNKLSFGTSSSLFAKVKQLQVYDTSLSDTQLAALTS